MRNKVITMCSKDYFQYGQRLLDTRQVVDADFVCYGPDLTPAQIDTLKAHDIHYKKVDQYIWDTWMQSLKFQFIMDEIDESGGGITFVDWDTYFLKDWGGIFFRAEWNFGVTVRKEYITKNKMLRAWANGGVIFVLNNDISRSDCENALKVIESNGLCGYINDKYDKIWKTLEYGRPPEKTHSRKNHRWWCDQIYLSAMAMQRGCDEGFPGIKLFDCRQYNNIWQETPDTYIMHLKDKSGAPKEFKDG